MSKPTDIDRLIAEARRDPERAARIDAYRAEIQEERRRYRQQTIFRIFADVTRAQEAPPDERARVLAGTRELILDDPELTERMLDSFDEIVEEPRLIIEAALLDAADPLTGQLPTELTLPAQMTALLDRDPALQAYRDDLPRMIRGDVDARMDQVADRMQPVLDQFFRERRIASQWMSIDLDEDVAEDQVLTVDLELVLRSSVHVHDSDQTTAEDQPSLMQTGEVRTLYADDPDGFYRLGVTHMLCQDGRYEVRFRVYAIGANQVLAASREEWRVTATLDGQQLAMVPDDLYLDAWQLAEPIALDDLVRLTYDVAFVPLD